MSMSRQFNGATLYKPGAYSRSFVNLSSGFPLGQTGIVGIVGEAEAGEPGSSAGVVTYSVAQLREIVETYKSGPIVEAARALAQPSRDDRLTNGASFIKIYKTNESTQATAEMDNLDDSASALFAVTSRNWGVNENLIRFSIEEGTEVDAAATVQSEAITFPLTIADSDTLIVNVNSTDYTLTLSGTASGTFTRANLIDLLNGEVVNGLTPSWSPSNPIVASEGDAATQIKLSIDNANAALDGYESRHEYGILSVSASSLATACELATATSVSASTLAITEGSAGPVRGSRGTRVFTITRNSTVNVIAENRNDVMFSIMYIGSGSASRLDIKDVAGVKRLQVSNTGAATDDLDLNLGDYTVQELVDVINSFGGGSVYACVTDYYNASAKNATDLDYYLDIDIKTMPLSVKAALKEMSDLINDESTLIEVTQASNVYGQLATASNVFLSGGSLGASTNSNFQAGFDAFLATRINTIVPLVSRDAADDAVDNLTDSSSTYTVDAVNLMADTHCRTASNTKNRSERDCYISKKASFQACIRASRAMNSEFPSLAVMDVKVVDTNGNLTWKPPYIFAALAAGMQAGAKIGEPITHKYMNCFGIRHEDFDPRTEGDLAIQSGLLFAEEPDNGGFRIVVGNSTYQRDANFVFNRKSVLNAAHYVSYNMRQQLEAIYIGTGRQRKESAAESVKNTVVAIMSQFLADGIIVGDDTNGGLGYRDLIVKVEGNTVLVDVVITPVQGVDFILSTIELDTIRDIA